MWKGSIMRKIIDLTGQKFGRLTAIKRVGSSKNKSALWLCKCDCGNEIIATSNNLRNGNTQSCGCLATEIRRKLCTKHNMRNTRIYRTWKSIRQRCYYERNDHYKYYGARGIIVCEEWKKDFLSFYNWAMANGYRDDLTIDRINVNGNYEPSNCRWITLKEQNNNRRSNHLITYNNETKNLQQWIDKFGIKRADFYYLLKKGYKETEILNILINKKTLDDVIEATKEAGLYDLPDVSLVDTSDQAEDLNPSAVIKTDLEKE